MWVKNNFHAHGVRRALNKKQVVGFGVLIVGIAFVVFAFQSMNRMASAHHQAGLFYSSDLLESPTLDIHENASAEIKGVFNTGLTLIAMGTGLAIFCRRRIKRS